MIGVMAGCNRNSGGSAGEQGNNSGSAQGGNASYAPDNTRRNERDRSESALTPGDQGSTEADRETTRRIRRAINSTDDLSTEAKNIKIITIDGKVTLRGPVKSTKEKTTIESIMQLAGVSTFDDQLEVKESNQ
jgi:osmotically-inducible protein OsmY